MNYSVFKINYNNSLFPYAKLIFLPKRSVLWVCFFFLNFFTEIHGSFCFFTRSVSSH